MKVTFGGVLTQLDDVPDQFTFIDQTDVLVATVITSAQIQVLGMDSAATAAISVDVGEYQINGGVWTAVAGTVSVTDFVAVRHTSSAIISTATNQTLTINGIQDTFTSTTSSGGAVVIPAGVLFYDDFEYTAPRIGKTSASNNPFVNTGGWTSLKDEDIAVGSAHGYLYTVTSIDGYAGILPGRNGTHALMLECVGGTAVAQTDYYVSLFNTATDPSGSIPPDVWFQFWIYPLNTATFPSQWGARNKFIYPSNDTYPSNDLRWLYQIGSANVNPNCSSVSNTAGCLSMMIDSRGGTFTIDPGDDCAGGASKLGMETISEYMVANRWTLVKIHIDTSTSAGTYEEWMRPMNGSWTKVSDWRSGVYPTGFTWDPNFYTGHKELRIPTTWLGNNAVPPDSYTLLGDFAMAGTEANLPTYSY
jgi:hypothetical protein